MPARKTPTVADLLALKGQRQLTEVLVRTPDEAAAAEAAGIDLISFDELEWTPDLVKAAPNSFFIVGLAYGMHATADEYIRAGFRFMNQGVAACYSAASVETVRRMFEEGIPVVSHVGLVPSKRTWTGGFKAVGKTAEQALMVYRATKRLEEAGAFAVEMEVVPDRVAAEISKRTRMICLSMGGGTGCDAQYLFADDILGQNRGHYPRHSKRYRDFATEYDRLQRERIAAFGEFKQDVASGAYPGPEHTVGISDEEFGRFMERLDT